MQVNHERHLIGHFNAHLELLLFLVRKAWLQGTAAGGCAVVCPCMCGGIAKRCTPYSLQLADEQSPGKEFLSILKELVTESTIIMEKKGKDSVQMPSYLR